jgi:UDP-glucose 4-epimerase
VTTILITGAHGFVGLQLAEQLEEMPGIKVLRGVRMKRADDALNAIEIGEICSNTDWTSSLKQVDVVVHCAARVHMMSDTSIDPLADFREVNSFGTLNLAKQAALAGVKRFVFVSSIKVNGETTMRGIPFLASGEAHPVDYYGVSKWEAEQGLRDIAINAGLEVVIVRPPLVYGPGVKANFLRLMNGIKKRIPLPFAGLSNLRSMVYVGNLVDLLCCCTVHPKAAGYTFLVSDGDDLSTPDLIRKLANAMGLKPKLFAIPDWLLKCIFRCVGKTELADRLCASLQVDITETRVVLGWAPPYTVDQGIALTVAEYLGPSKDCL